MQNLKIIRNFKGGYAAMNIEEFKAAITVIVDTRENRCASTLAGLSQMDVKFRVKKLNFGDYSYEIAGKSYENKICIEKKNSFTEIAGCFVNNKRTRNRDRFKREFERAVEAGAKVVLLIEDEKEKLLLRKTYDANKEMTAEQRQKGTWRSQLSANSLIASIASWKDRYNLDLVFTDKRKTASEMVGKFFEYYERDGDNCAESNKQVEM